MNSNTCSPDPTIGSQDDLATLAAAVDGLAARDLTGLADGVRAERVLVLRRLVDRLEGQWLAELAGVDARGSAGADQGTPAPSTASWLRGRLRLGASAAASAVRTARALFRGPLSATAQALCDGELSVAHASALAHGTHDLADHVAAEAEPVLVAAARRLDPPRLRRVIAHRHQVADPEGAADQAERRHSRRGLWLAPTFEGMVALQGLLEAEAGQILLAALAPLARPASGDDPRSSDQRRADALTELARRPLEGGQLPQTGGVRPQLTVVVDLDSLLGRQPVLGGEPGWVGPLAPEACRRLACDGALTRVLVSRHQPGHQHAGHRHDQHPADYQPGDQHPGQIPNHGSGAQARPVAWEPSEDGRLAGRLRMAMALLPPILGGAPSQPLEWAGPAGSSPRPTQRPGRPRPRLCLPRL